MLAENLTPAGKDKAVMDWVAQGTDKAVLFNFLPEAFGSLALIPISSDSVVKRYTRTGAQRRYDFALQLMAPLSQSVDETNLTAMYAMRQWQEWIKEQEKSKNYPDFGDSCSNYRLENLSNMPQLAMAYTDGEMAKYQFFGCLHYYEER